MKNVTWLCIFCFSLALMLGSCKGCKQACKEKKRVNQTETQDFDYLSYVDESVKKLFGDSITNIVFNPDGVTLLRVSPKPYAPGDTLKKDSLPSFRDMYILQQFTPSAEQVGSLLLLLSDKDTYFLSEDMITMPFSPYAALRFSKSNEKVDLIFSIAGGRIKIYYKDFVSREIKYIPERLVIKYFLRVMQDPMLKSMLDY